jgi:hypothetical protein
LPPTESISNSMIRPCGCWPGRQCRKHRRPRPGQCGGRGPPAIRNPPPVDQSLRQFPVTPAVIKSPGASLDHMLAEESHRTTPRMRTSNEAGGPGKARHQTVYIQTIDAFFGQIQPLPDTVTAGGCPGPLLCQPYSRYRRCFSRSNPAMTISKKSNWSSTNATISTWFSRKTLLTSSWSRL